ncbi:BCCT family transporter [Microbacterium karelineae]|uniref:BCCT family transporter n=1 Tax=Microbacterium karelineae TaxID=2654283 RepID=UPI0018D398F8|nr:BCCT family transporter [Microbacterium karelineae]
MHIAEDDSDAQITEKLRRQGVRIGKGMIAPRVFWPAFIVIALVTVLSLVFPDAMGTAFNTGKSWIADTLGWYYMLIIGVFVVFVVVIAFSKLGTIKLGREGDKPEFSIMAWFAMLFSAGMGIGLIFYGVGEPVTYATIGGNPSWEGTESELAGLAMAQTFVHWGLHPWAIYAVIGLALAYAIHRRGRPVSIRWALEPLFGDRVKGWVGDVIDILAIFGTVFGVATSLGLGVQQIASGMQAIGVVGSTDTWLLVTLIAVITLLATISVVSGLGAGIKWLSNINLSLAGVLLVSMLLLGPTLFLLRTFVESLGVYFANVFHMTLDVGAFASEDTHAWLSGWTLFYWGWWIAWAPFVGVFIARISRGRTVRQFIAGVLLVPTIVGFFWFSVMGGSGIFRQMFGEGDLVQTAEDGTQSVSAEGSLFTVLGDLPLGNILSILAIIVVAIFFITSSDSGSLVVDMLASGGHPNPPVWSRVLWAVLEGVLALGLLLAGGSDALSALQAGSLLTALPFSVIMILMAIALVKALRYEHRQIEHEQTVQRLERLTEFVTDEMTHSLSENPELQDYVDDRIDYRISRTRGLRRPGTRGPRGSE